MYPIFAEIKATPLNGRSRGKNVMQTPANNPTQLPGGLPFITPKFNTSTPAHR